MTTAEFKKVLEANRGNTDMLGRIVSEVNGWNGGLEDYELYEFDDDFFDTYFAGKPMDAARATYFGEIESWSDDYIRFNGYGNLESLSSYRREQGLEEGAGEIIAAALDYFEHVDAAYIIEGLEA